MVKAVLTTKVDPSYDDLPEDRYHFPRTYLNAAREALGDWIVYYCVFGRCRSPPEKRSSIAALGHSGLGLYRTRFSGPTGDTCLGRPEVALGQWECLLGHQ